MNSSQICIHMHQHKRTTCIERMIRLTQSSEWETNQKKKNKNPTSICTNGGPFNAAIWYRFYNANAYFLYLHVHYSLFHPSAALYVHYLSSYNFCIGKSCEIISRKCVVFLFLFFFKRQTQLSIDDKFFKFLQLFWFIVFFFLAFLFNAMKILA